MFIYETYNLKMFIPFLLILSASPSRGQPSKCDQTPPKAGGLPPSDNKGIYTMTLDTAEKGLYLPAQTYVLILSSSHPSHPFRGFMITAEDPKVDNIDYSPDTRYPDAVGSLKTLDTDTKSRYSSRCFTTVENSDDSFKHRVEIHWVSPKHTDTNQRIRIRATVVENDEVWYEGEGLTIELKKDDQKPIDSPPLELVDECQLCSEARYEVIFKGHWSRLTHPRHYPVKPDHNGYSPMIGASHAPEFDLWKQGSPADDALKLMAEQANTTALERKIIDAISPDSGTRTLIRGKRRHHPHMAEPSHSLFRVDSVHHRISLVVAMRPSPDWFLGTYHFELCDKTEWLSDAEIPLYPWDAGSMNGISYESATSITQPQDNIERVAVGSFDRDSPFYQMNLAELKPFAHLQVTRLDVYPVVSELCEGAVPEVTPTEPVEEQDEEPQVQELRPYSPRGCLLSEWGEWTACAANNDICGEGTQIRSRYKQYEEEFAKDEVNGSVMQQEIDCNEDNTAFYTDYRICFVDC